MVGFIQSLLPFPGMIREYEDSIAFPATVDVTGFAYHQISAPILFRLFDINEIASSYTTRDPFTEKCLTVFCHDNLLYLKFEFQGPWYQSRIKKVSKEEPLWIPNENRVKPESQSRPIKGVIFDLGHTLMNFHGDWDDVYRQGNEALHDFLTKKGYSVSPEVIQHFFSRRYEGHLEADKTWVEHTAVKALQETFQKFNLNGTKEGLLLDALETYFLPEIENWKPYPDSISTLERLRKEGYRLALISNATHHPFILSCLQRFGFEEYLDPAVSSAAFPVRKPHPDIFLHVKNAWGFDPEEIAYVGDQLFFDVFGAHQVGMKGIWFKQETDKAHTYIPEDLKNDPRLTPDATILQLSDLPKVLQSWK